MTRLGLGDRITCGRCGLSMEIKRRDSRCAPERCGECGRRQFSRCTANGSDPAHCHIEPRCLPDWGYNPDGTPA